MARGPLGLFISQRTYALETVDECGLLGSKLVDFPIEENHKLAITTWIDLHDPSRYRRLVGRLICLTITRPELNYVVHILSQFMQNPKEAHMDVALVCCDTSKVCPVMVTYCMLIAASMCVPTVMQIGEPIHLRDALSRGIWLPLAGLSVMEN